jgi:hypothetical protein
MYSLVLFEADFCARSEAADRKRKAKKERNLMGAFSMNDKYTGFCHLV